MEYRELGGTGWKVSTISFGAWGDVKDEELLAALHRALDLLQLHSPAHRGLLYNPNVTSIR